MSETTGMLRIQGEDHGRTLVEQAYASLRREILEGALEPGAKLRTEELRQRYGIGASTVRESLTRLLGEALVTAEGQRGFRVAPISLDDFSDLTHVRKMIETEALRQSILAGDEAWESRVVAAYYRLSKVEERIREEPQAVAPHFEERNREFHLALISACPSARLHRIYAMLYQQSERYRRVALINRARARRSRRAQGDLRGGAGARCRASMRPDRRAYRPHADGPARGAGAAGRDGRGERQGADGPRQGKPEIGGPKDRRAPARGPSRIPIRVC